MGAFFFFFLSTSASFCDGRREKAHWVRGGSENDRLLREAGGEGASRRRSANQADDAKAAQNGGGDNTIQAHTSHQQLPSAIVVRFSDLEEPQP